MDIICEIGDQEKALLKKAMEQLSLSARAYNKILKVSRTIADLEHSINIQKRFKNHTSGKSVDSIFRKIFEFRKHCFFWYKYLPKSSKDELRMREQELINVFGAPLNKINSVSQEGSLIGGFLD